MAADGRQIASAKNTYRARLRTLTAVKTDTTEEEAAGEECRASSPSSLWHKLQDHATTMLGTSRESSPFPPRLYGASIKLYQGGTMVLHFKTSILEFSVSRVPLPPPPSLNSTSQGSTASLDSSIECK